MKNAKEAVEEFEKKYRWDRKDIWRQEREENKEIFARGELLGRFMAKNYLDGQIKDIMRNIKQGIKDGIPEEGDIKW